MTADERAAPHTRLSESAGESTGRLFIVSAPSGAGKSTLCRAVRRQTPGLAYSISFTTRPPRPGELDGRDYHFISVAQFELGIADGRWAEWARVHGNYYGSSARWIQRTLSRGRDILMDIDVQGARQIVRRFPRAVTIFVMAPNLAILEERLKARGTDDAAAIRLRLANAREELAQRERYTHIVINDDLSTATQTMIDLIAGYRGVDKER